MKIRHYYHVYATGAWAEPVRDHFIALARSGLDDTTTTIGLVGSEHDRGMARGLVTLRSRTWALPEPVAWREEDEGWEQVTLRAIHEDVNVIPGDYAVLYAHTKGAYRNTDDNAMWRRSMTRHLVYKWEKCTRLLEEGYDAVGCHWVKAPEWPEQPPFFAGNFWWARSSYLRTLPEPLNETRWQPETWISLGEPKIHDMLPGWPEYG